jgi:retinol dehydrogenase-13
MRMRIPNWLQFFLTKKTKDTGITVNALHPGVLATSALRDYPGILLRLMNLFFENPQKGGERIAYLATSDELTYTTGMYFNKMAISEIDIPDEESQKAARLWQIVEDLTGLPF